MLNDLIVLISDRKSRKSFARKLIYFISYFISYFNKMATQKEEEKSDFFVFFQDFRYT